MGLAGQTLATLIANLTLDSAGFTTGVEKINTSLGGMKWDLLGKSAVAAGTTAAAGISVSIKKASEFETAFAGVKKTVDAPMGVNANEFFDGLQTDILKLSTTMPVAAEDIAGVYQAAGQLGVESGSLTEFSTAMLEFESATNGLMKADDAAAIFAQYSNVTGTADEDIDNLASTVVALGNNMATTEPDILNMAQRIAAAGSQAGMSDAEIMGWSASMASVGLKAESAGTSFSKFTQGLVQDVATGSDSLETYADTAGMSVDDFKKLFEEDASGAVQKFIEGLGKLDSDEMYSVFDNLEIKETRQIDTLSRLAGGSGEVKKAMDISNTAFSEGAALSDEAAMANSTLESKYAMLKNSIDAAAIRLGDAFLPLLTKIVEWVTPLITKLTDWIAENEELAAGIMVAIVAIGLIAGLLIILGTTIGAISAIATAFGAIMSVVFSPITLIIAGIIAAIIILKAAWDQNLGGIQEKTQAVIDAIKGYYEKLKAKFEEGGIREVLTTIASDIWAKIKEIAGKIKDSVVEKFNELKENAIQKFAELKDSAVKKFTEIKDDIWEKMTGVATSALDWGKNIIDNLKSGISSAWESVKTWIDTNILGFFSGIQVDVNPFDGDGLSVNFGGAKAGGGLLSSNEYYLVGEKGPELFMPNTSGTLFTNDELNSMTSDDHSNTVGDINIYISGAVNDGTKTGEDIGREIQRQLRYCGVC